MGALIGKGLNRAFTVMIIMDKARSCSLFFQGILTNNLTTFSAMVFISYYK